jgi:hypothetical protein
MASLYSRIGFDGNCNSEMNTRKVEEKDFIFNIRIRRTDYARDRNKSTSIFIAGSEWIDAHIGGVQGEEGHFIFLSEGQYSGLYQAGLQLWRVVSSVSGKRSCGSWGEQGQRSIS